MKTKCQKCKKPITNHNGTHFNRDGSLHLCPGQFCDVCEEAPAVKRVVIADLDGTVDDMAHFCAECVKEIAATVSHV